MFYLRHVTFAFVMMTSIVLIPVSGQSNSTDVPEEAVLDFDCRRGTSECDVTASCDVSSGDCSCDNSTTTARDYKCADNVASGTCTGQCENGAVCVNSVCNCPESYYGEFCQMNRVQVDCDGTNMYFNVFPDVKTFSGIIFVESKDEEENCQLKATSTLTLGDYVEKAEYLEGWGIGLPHTGSNCGDVTGEEGNMDDGANYTSYSRQFMVRYNQNFRTSLDQVITAECRVSEGGTKIYSGGSVVNETDSSFTGVDVKSDVETVTMYVHHGDGSRIDSGVVLGDDIQLVFSLAPASGFQDFYITGCSANNTDTDPSTVKVLPFITDKCPDSAAFSLFRSSLTKEEAETATDPVIIRVDMKAFMFTGRFNKVAFACDIVLCETTGDPECQEIDCAGVVSSKEAIDNSPVPEVTEAPEVDQPDVENNNNTGGNSTGDGIEGIFDDNNNSTTNGTEDMGGDINNNGTQINGSEINGNDTNVNGTDGTVNGTDSNVNGTDTSVNGTNVNATDTNITDSTSSDDSVNENLRRRRRSAGEQHQRAYTEMTVYGPGGLAEEDIKKLNEILPMTDCMTEPEIVACIAILSTAVVILLTVSVMLAVNHIRSRPRTTRHKVDVNDEPHVECLRIPRLELHHPYNNITNQRC